MQVTFVTFRKYYTGTFITSFGQALILNSSAIVLDMPDLTIYNKLLMRISLVRNKCML